MSYNVSIAPGAEKDIAVAYGWYEEQKAGLGDDFLEALIEHYKKLEHNPKVFGKLNKSYRKLAIKRFPYVIIFEIIKKDIIVYAVFHTSRDPKYLPKK